MFAVGKTASGAVRTILSFIVISVFALWVTEAHASSSGGTGGGSSSGGNNGGGNNGGGGPSGGPSGGPGEGDRGGFFNDRRDDTVTRDRAQPGTVPQGFVMSDDICTGGKWEKC